VRAGHVTAVNDALAAAGVRRATTIGPEHGSTVLEQHALRLDPGEVERHGVTERHEVLYVAAGGGRVTVGGGEAGLAPESGVFAAAGEDLELEAGPEGLELVVTRTPADHPASGGDSRVVAYAERPDASAGIGRTFRLLVDADAGCRDVTQFIGVVPPGRAKMHNHPYDELSYVVEGEGMMHWEDGTGVPVGAGSCIHFPRLVLHSLENTGGADLRIMGVFHPAGSPADRVTVLDY
jgi:mannose-6-phosphate isomerase-like protein (cupin superfamily)